MKQLVVWMLATFALAVESRAGETVLYIGPLDRDAFADTIVGIVVADLRLLPTAIDWGAPYSTDGLRRRRTRIDYPDWRSLNGSFAVEDVNDDGIDDLLLFFNGGSSGAHDSSRALAILGRNVLHDVEAIDLARVPRGALWSPYVAIDLEVAGLLKDAGERDLSGVTSYRLSSVPIALADSSGRGSIAAMESRWIALYPNPASTAATFQAGVLEPGEYMVELVDVNGITQSRQPLEVAAERSVTGIVDVQRQPAGIYLVIIRQGDETLMSLPIVVVR